MTIKANDRNRLLDLADHTCFYCGGKGPMEIDHIYPISKGGVDKISNYVVACLGCNRTKHDRLLPKPLRNKAFSLALKNHYIIKEEIAGTRVQRLIDRGNRLASKIIINPVLNIKEESLTIRGIDRQIWRRFKAKCILLGIPAGQGINRLIAEDVKQEPRFEDIEEELHYEKI